MSYTRAHQKPTLSPPQNEPAPRSTKVPPAHSANQKKSTVSTNGVKTSSSTSTPNKS